MKPNQYELYFYFYPWFVSTRDERSPRDKIKMDIFLFLNCINMGCKITMRPKQDEHNILVLTCINMEMQDHHETKTRRILVASCALSLHHYRIEEWYMTTRYVMHYLDLYQHGIKIAMRPNQAQITWVAPNIYEVYGGSKASSIKRRGKI